MKNEQLALHIEKMIEDYREINGFNKEDVNKLMELADFTNHEIGYYLNKFHYIHTNIAENGGIPMLKAALHELKNN